MRIVVPGLAGSCLVTLSTLAAAQSAEPSPTGAAPHFRSLGPDGTSGFGADLQIVMPPDDDENPIYRLDLRGEYVDEVSGFGGFTSLAVGHYSDDGTGESESSLGDLEVGGLFRHANGQSQVTGRIGLVLPTADDDEVPIPLYAALFADPTNAILGFPETTSMRVAVTPGWTDGRFFVRGDAGLDLTIDRPDDDLGGDEENLQVLHLDGGFGFLAGALAGTFELQNVWLMGDGDTMRVNHVGASVQYAAPNVNVYGGIGKVFFEEDDFFSDDEIWDLGFGVRGKL